MTDFYNEIDPYAAAWLKNLIAGGLLPAGDVDERSVVDVRPSDLVGYATQVGLDLDKWNTCRQDPKQEAEIMADFEAGQKVGVTGTPAFFINGIMLSGALPYDQFKVIIDRELAGT